MTRVEGNKASVLTDLLALVKLSLPPREREGERERDKRGRASERERGRVRVWERANKTLFRVLLPSTAPLNPTVTFHNVFLLMASVSVGVGAHVPPRARAQSPHVTLWGFSHISPAFADPAHISQVSDCQADLQKAPHQLFCPNRPFPTEALTQPLITVCYK